MSVHDFLLQSLQHTALHQPAKIHVGLNESSDTHVLRFLAPKTETECQIGCLDFVTRSLCKEHEDNAERG
jgi:hypothetical protein